MFKRISLKTCWLCEGYGASMMQMNMEKVCKYIKFEELGKPERIVI